MGELCPGKLRLVDCGETAPDTSERLSWRRKARRQVLCVVLSHATPRSSAQKPVTPVHCFGFSSRTKSAAENIPTGADPAVLFPACSCLTAARALPVSRRECIFSSAMRTIHSGEATRVWHHRPRRGQQHTTDAGKRRACAPHQGEFADRQTENPSARDGAAGKNGENTQISAELWYLLLAAPPKSHHNNRPAHQASPPHQPTQHNTTNATMAMIASQISLSGEMKSIYSPQSSPYLTPTFPHHSHHQHHHSNYYFLPHNHP